MHFPLTVTLANHLATLENLINPYLVGGFNPVKKYWRSNWIIWPGKGENKRYLKPPSKYDLSIMEYENPSSFAPFGSPGRRKGPGRQHKGSCRMPKHGENSAAAENSAAENRGGRRLKSVSYENPVGNIF